MTTKSMMKTLSNRLVRKLTVEKDTVFWDRDLTASGCGSTPPAQKSTSPRRGDRKAPGA